MTEDNIEKTITEININSKKMAFVRIIRMWFLLKII